MNKKEQRYIQRKIIGKKVCKNKRGEEILKEKVRTPTVREEFIL